MNTKQAKALSRTLRRCLRRQGVKQEIVNRAYVWQSCSGTLVVGNFLYMSFSKRQLRLMTAAIPGIEKALRRTYLASGAYQPLAWRLPVPPQRYDWGTEF